MKNQMKTPKDPRTRIVARFEPLAPEEWDRQVLDLLAHLDQVEAAAALGVRRPDEWDYPGALRAYRVAREAMLALWGSRGEPGAESPDEVERHGAEERAAARAARVDAMHEVLAGSVLVQAVGLVRGMAGEFRAGRREEARAVDDLLRMLEALGAPDVGDLGALRASPARCAEIATWLRKSTDGPPKPGAPKARALKAHAVLARIVEASHARPTDMASIKPVVIAYWKQLKHPARRKRRGEHHGS